MEFNGAFNRQGLLSHQIRESIWQCEWMRSVPIWIPGFEIER
jgi:hypothetical protein